MAAPSPDTPPNPAATTSPPASAATRPLIFVLSPPTGTVGEDRYYYAPNADVTDGDYAAFLVFAASYCYSLAIYQCPDINVFQASHPTVNIRPFGEVSAVMTAIGREVVGYCEYEEVE